MTVVTSRADFEKLMDLRMKEAKALLDLKDWDGAYYLVGYAVEFALKIRIIGQLMKSDRFPDKKAVENFYKHELPGLRTLAALDVEMDNDPAIASQWKIVKDWSEQTRYQIGMKEQEATDLYDAIEKGCCRGSRHAGRRANCRWPPIRRAIRCRRQPGRCSVLGPDLR